MNSPFKEKEIELKDDKKSDTIDMKGEKIIAFSPKKNKHSRIEKFLEAEKVDLKWLFDHFRNYGIAGALMYAAQHVLNKPSVSVIPHFNKFAATSFFFISIGLFIFNFVNGINAYKKHFGELPRFWVYLAGFVIWFMLMQELLGIRLSGA